MGSIVAQVWTGIGFSIWKNFRTRIQIQKFWNRSGVGVWRSDSKHQWCARVIFVESDSSQSRVKVI